MCDSYTKNVTLCMVTDFLSSDGAFHRGRSRRCSASGVAPRAAHNTRRGRGLRRVFDDVMVRVSRDTEAVPPPRPERRAARRRRARLATGARVATIGRSSSSPGQSLEPPQHAVDPLRGIRHRVETGRVGADERRQRLGGRRVEPRRVLDEERHRRRASSACSPARCSSTELGQAIEGAWFDIDRRISAQLTARASERRQAIDFRLLRLLLLEPIGSVGHRSARRRRPHRPRRRRARRTPSPRRRASTTARPRARGGGGSRPGIAACVARRRPW